MMEELKYKVSGGNEGAKITLESSFEKGIEYVNVHMSMEKAEIPQEFCVTFSHSANGVRCIWTPENSGELIRANWSWNKVGSALATWMPIAQAVSAEDMNSICVAVSDAFIPTEVRVGISEENATVDYKVRFFTAPTTPIAEYNAKIRIDRRNIPYCDCIYDVSKWWKQDCGYTPAFVPEAAKEPMDSLWYSFHQMLDADEIVKECTESVKYGMKTVIIDDGWQTDDNNRGYAYCGDWDVAPKKMGDMAELVRRIHEVGMKVMIWYSVPFVGIYSKKCEEFRDKALWWSNNGKFFALDPRYKEVRDYLIDIYTTAVKEWKLDGLKLDFIDSFKLTEETPVYDARRDYSSLEEATDALMRTIVDELVKINPEILLEFRQSYIGPAIRQYGNMLRVADCPYSAVTNHKQIINLRYTSGNTAVHSDMLMWNKTEAPETAALQFVGAIFGVPQVSVKIWELPDNQKRMVKHYLEFWREYRDVLLDGKLIGENPLNNYSIAHSTLGDCSVFVTYSNSLIDVKTERAAVINATSYGSLVVKNCNAKPYSVVNCMGDILETGEINGELCEISVPLSGMIFINK